MKKAIAILLFLCFAVCLPTGCTAKKEPAELVVFAAASMTETLTQLGEQYMTEHENVNVVFNFDSSGTLKTQIEEGADCDVFISAGRKQMDGLESLYDPDSRFDILENKVVLAGSVESFDALAEGLKNGTVLLAMGNADVPVGQYTEKILEYYGLSEEELEQNSCITYGSNVKEVTTQVSEGAVDCGIMYQTDAFSAGLTVMDTATAEMCGQVIYPAAIIKAGRQQELAKNFLDYLCSSTADAVFEAVGFTPIG